MDIKVIASIDGNEIDLNAFYDMLEKHTWNRITQEDLDFYKELLKRANQTPEHRQLFEEYRNYKFSGKDYGTKQLPKPERPIK